MSIKKLNKLKKSAAKCTNCLLHEGRDLPVFSKGNPKADIVICGMAPAKEENIAGVPFVGRSGRLLDTVLDAAGIKDYYITNLVKCYVPAGVRLTPHCMDVCSDYFCGEVDYIKPKVLIYLGSDVTSYLLGTDRKMFKDIRGQLMLHDMYTTIPTYHPSYALRMGGVESKQWDMMVDDFKLAKEIVDNPVMFFEDGY